MAELVRRVSTRPPRSRRIGTRRSPTVLAVLAGVCAFLVVGCLVSSVFAQQTVAGLAQGAIFGSLALALVLIYRATEVINFAQGEMAMATTYVAFELTKQGLTYWEAFFATLAIAFVFGVVVQVLVIRPVQRHSPIAVVIVTVGLIFLIDGLVTWRWGAQIQFMRLPFGTTVYHAGDVTFSRQNLGVLLVTVVSVMALWALFQLTKLGLAMRAAALRPAAASLVGVRVGAMLAIGWGLAAMLGAVAGMMTEPTQFLQPSMMQSILVYAFAAAVVGSLESPTGAVVGGLLLGVFLNLVGQYVPFFGDAELRLPVALAVLLVVLLVKPSGLFGRPRVRTV